MDRAASWLMGTGAKWNGNDHCWSLPCTDGGFSKLVFGYMDNDKDRYRYQSAEFQFIGWDELTQFPKGWYTWMFSRLRRPKHASRALSSVPLRMRGAGNPGGIGHKWVKNRFIDDPGPREFVPAKLTDNPHIDQASYRESLAELDPINRAQLLDGLWVVDSSGLVYQWDPERNARTDQPDYTNTVLGIDFGYTDSTAFSILGWSKHSQTLSVLWSHKEAGLIPSACAEVVRELDAVYHFDRIVGDVGGLGKGYAEEMRQRFSIPIKPAEKKNKLGYISLLNGALARGELLIVKPSNQELIRELEELPWNEARTAEEPGFENHLTDSLLYAWREAKAFWEKPAGPELPAYGTLERKQLDLDKHKQKLITDSLARAAKVTPRQAIDKLRRY